MKTNEKDNSNIYSAYESQQDSLSKVNTRAAKISNKDRKRRKRKKVMKVVIIILIILVIIFCLISRQPKYDIASIEVTGNKQMTKNEIISDSEIKVGDNIFKMNVLLKEKKMKLNPFYSKVDIKREFPDKITIDVEERKPTIAFPYGEKFVLINSDGIVMKLSDENPRLSEIVGVTIKSMERGEVLKTNDDELFEKSLEFLSLVDENDLFFKRIDLRKKNAKLNDYDNLYVKGRIEAITSSIENGNLKKVLIDLYSKGMKRGTIVIDDDQTCSFTPKYN